MEMISYKGDTSLKKKVVAEIRRHRKMDAIEQGHYGKKNGYWRGCAVSCTLRSLAIINGEKLEICYNDHKRYETDLGIPVWLAILEDTIFEGLSKKEAKLWPEQFAKAIPVGVNLEPVKWKFCAFILKENIKRVLSLKIEDALKTQVVEAIRGVLSLHENAIKTSRWDENAARSAESAAESAESAAWSAESAAESAESAAWSAESAAESAESAAENAAWSAAWSAESAARSAARSAENAAWSAESVLWNAAYKKYAKELISLLEKAK